jgi:hypothetical protein
MLTSEPVSSREELMSWIKEFVSGRGHWKRLRGAAARAGDGAPDYYRAATAP